MKTTNKLRRSLLAIFCTAFMIIGCTGGAESEKLNTEATEDLLKSAYQIVLSDNGVTLDGKAVTSDASSSVYVANDIVYYEKGKDFTYGEGSEEDAHSKEEADAHMVVHITEPGVYALSGKLSAGQVAVDLGEDAEENSDAVVTLLLNGVDISCTVAPAVIFYNVYECGSAEPESASKDVDTTAAGANVYIMDKTENTVSGSYVAKIYESYELNEDGTEVVDSKKLHKYDAAFYSRMSMNMNGGAEDSGVLNIYAENEGLDSELHLTINGGDINIISGNDGINTNEDGVSVTTINGGRLNIKVDGSTGEGDGIDSNGWLVINGGTVLAQACAFSGDAGIDSDIGIHINGGTVLATGNMLDRISDSKQNFVVFQFTAAQKAGAIYRLKNEREDILAECQPENDFMYFIFSSEALTEGHYTLWVDELQLEGTSGNAMGGFGGWPGGERPGGEEMPGGIEPPKGEFGDEPEGKRPEDLEPPKDEPGDWPEGERPEDRFTDGQGGQVNADKLSSEFKIMAGGNYFMIVGHQ